MNTTTHYRILYQNSSFVWNIKSPFKIDRKYLIEIKNDVLFIRNFLDMSGNKNKIQHYSVNSALETKNIPLDVKNYFSISTLTYPEAANLEKAKSITPNPIPQELAQSPEDISFRKSVKSISTISAILSIIVLFLNFMEKTPDTNEEIIPKKYAKLLLTKPTNNNASSGSSARSQAQTKAIARAFQSKTVQKSIQSILQGGISKYSIMSTGRSIQNLSQKIQSQTAESGAGLDKKAQGLLGAMNAGNFQIGSENGYGSGTKTNVKGQGTGHLEIGLNLKDATVDEGLTKEEVAKVIHSHMNEIRYCYESAILGDPSLSGKLLVDFKIGSQGNVSTAQTGENTMNNTQVSACLVGKLKNWKFPNPRGGVQVAVSYPFIFKSLTR